MRREEIVVWFDKLQRRLDDIPMRRIEREEVNEILAVVMNRVRELMSIIEIKEKGGE